MGKKLFLGVISCVFTLVLQGQTVVWQMKPSDYNEMVRLGSNLLKVSRNNKIGLANTDGNIVAPIVNDGITDYYEHKALLLTNDGHGERVTGCLTDDGKYYSYAEKYYTLNGQKFFSDGMLSVADENGMLGYIDIIGNKVVGFEGKYSRIKPYTEGYAAVMKNKKYVLIDKSGEEVRFVYGGSGVGAAIGGCTNVFNGQCYVYDEYGGSDRSYFIYDTKEKGKLKKTSRVKNTAMDYLFCYQSVSGRGKEIPYEHQKNYTGIKGIEPSQSDGLYGFRIGELTILPCQLSDATQFVDGLAIVEVNGFKGILKYVDGESFDVSVSKDKYSFYAGNSVTLSFTLAVPNVWRNKLQTVVVKDANGVEQTLSESGNNYSFTVNPTSSSKLDFFVQVFGDELKLFDGAVSYTLVKKEKCPLCGKDKEQCEFRGNHPIGNLSSGKDSVSDNGKVEEDTERVCEDCGKKISECKYRGVH